jgi:hypothetical protein
LGFVRRDLGFFFVHVYVNRETRRPSKIEDNRRAAFQSLIKADAQ